MYAIRSYYGFLEVGRDLLALNPDTRLVVFIHRIENVIAIGRESSYIMRPRQLQIVNMLGYADAYLAGIVHAIRQDMSLKDSLLFASAAGLANVESINKDLDDTAAIHTNLSRIDMEEI